MLSLSVLSLIFWTIYFTGFVFTLFVYVILNALLYPYQFNIRHIILSVLWPFIWLNTFIVRLFCW
jgi:hypothetical protein